MRAFGEKFRILCAVLLAAALLAGSAAHAADDGKPSFRDIGNHWAKSVIEWAAANGIANGFADGTFRPNLEISEREFLALVLRAFPEYEVPEQRPGEPWYVRYYEAADRLGWPVVDKEAKRVYTRGDAARIIAAAQGQRLSVREAVQYLLDNGIANGKTGATYEGFAAGDPLTRAEALTFIFNAKRTGAAAESPAYARLRGVAIGDSESAVLAALGEPDRRDPSAAGYTWLVYNRDYAAFAQIGVAGGRVVALFSSADVWERPDGLKPGAPLRTAAGQAGVTLSKLRESDDYTFSVANLRVTLYLDLHGNKVEALLVEREDAAGTWSSRMPSDDMRDALERAYERQIHDLNNVFRLKNGLEALEWNETAAKAARLHSEDMAVRAFFDHVNPDGERPWERMAAAGLSEYRAVGENIAAGYRNAFEAHTGWVNSPDHRENMLEEWFETLGVGVRYVPDSEYGWYYTQNFFSSW
jgi:uncharacterized protein YkwD